MDGLTPEQAAEKMGIDVDEYSKIENGVGINLEQAKALSRIFNTPITSLIGDSTVLTNDPAMLAYLVDNNPNASLRFEVNSKYLNLNITKSDAVEKISAMLRIFSASEIKEVYDFVNSLYHKRYIEKSDRD